MIKRILFALAFCGIAFSPTAHAAIALDGSATSGIQSSNVCTATLTTSNANDIIVVFALENQGNNNPLVSISSTNTTGWAQRAINLSGFITEWHGKAAAALSSETITVTADATSTVCTVHAFGISGADQSTIYDSNGALPSTGGATTVSITTSNANDIIFAGYRFGTTSSPTNGAGWTQIQGNGNMLTEYQVVSTTQSGVTATIGTGNTDENGGIGDAIIAATATAAVPMRTRRGVGQ